MSTNQNQNSGGARVFVDYIPAEIKQTNSNDWRVVYYVKIPGIEKLKRYRKRVPPLKNKRNREKLAQTMCKKINEALERGWSPFYDGFSVNKFKKFTTVMDQFLDQATRKQKDGVIRPDSLRSYTSFINNIKTYLKDKKLIEMHAVDFTRDFIIEFLDYIYFERKRSARTCNNYLSFLNQIGIFMQDRKLIVSNPVGKIAKRKQVKKKREILPAWVRDDIFNYWKTRNKAFLTLCLTTYFCFIRRTEITKLLVKHVNLKESIVFIPGLISKNGKDGTVTIPKQLAWMLADHINGKMNSDYLFSTDNYYPGKKPVPPKKISDEWAGMRKALKLDEKYQFYSLKDTGITNLLLLGVPAKKVRDQARHHDIRITESYVSRNEKADEELKSIDFEF